ncbi:protein DEHYDRATION-INDUCED 19-like [Impatiens glandulifera]|uniref:protein DEHYDRATION-INDUCED 19-like n=1 Tax=Impatiens glandulifera TaxID=253017 RepID=UPI001FB12794|nr:protein DEHYDRATION-INDUCED 19-like [Impatiens glandulifera]
MDSDFWATRLAAAKRQFTMQHRHHQASHLDRLNIDDFEVEEDVRHDFICPYCYEDFDIVSLCSHLEDDHSCESKVALCPICSAVARDMLSHITLQHGSLFKLQRRRRLRSRVAIPNTQTTAFSLLGRDLRDAHLQVLLGGGGSAYRSSSSSTINTTTTAAADPLLSSLILNFPPPSESEAEDIPTSSILSSVDDNPKKQPLPHIWKSSFDSTLSEEEREKRRKQAAVRVDFVQDLLASTLLGESS